MLMGVKSNNQITAFGVTRTGGTALDAAAVQQRSRSFGASVARLKGPATLLAMRDEYGLNTMLLTKDSSTSAKAAADALAHSVQGKADPVDAPDLACESVGYLSARPNSAAGRETTAGADPAEVARTIERATVPGSWVAVTLRPPTSGELKRTRKWFDFRSVPGTHYSREGEAMVASFYAGGPDASTVEMLLSNVISVLPGFDVEADVHTMSSSGAAWLTGGVGALLWGALGPGHDLVAPALANLPGELGTLVTDVGLGTSAVLSAACLGIVSGVIPTTASRMRDALASSTLPAPASELGVTKRAPRKESKKADGTIVPEFAGDYPLAHTAFLVGPSVVVGVAAPYGGGSAGAAVTRERDTPPALLARIGPAVGTSPKSGLAVHLSAADFSASIGIMGVPDAGKAIQVSERVPVPVSARFPDGWATIGELEVGDEVYAPDGSITGIVRTTEPFLGMSYELVTDDDQSFITHESHLWSAAAKIDRRAHSRSSYRIEVARENQRSAQRLRALAAATPAGTAITATEAAPLLGVEDRAAMVFARNAGIPESRARIGSRTAACWPMGEVLSSYADHLDGLGGHKKAGRAPRPLHQVVTTEQMYRSLRAPDGAANWALSSVDSIASVTGLSDVPVEPYLVGLWLGDGSSRCGSITVGADDFEAVHAIISSLWPKVDHTLSADGSYDVRLVRHGDGPLDFSFTEALSGLGLIGHKHIPAPYLRASTEVRLELLRGLLDADGSIDSTGRIELALSDERLAGQALELVRSLGIKAALSSGPDGYRDPEGEYVECKDRHRIHFTTTLPVFRLPRKAARIPSATRSQRDWLYVTDIRPVGEQEVRCITVDHPSANFLVGGFVPTHNSVALRSIFGWHCLERVAPSGQHGFPGRASTLIAFENKGEGAQMYERWATGLGDDPVRIDVADPRTAAIDMFDIPGTTREKALMFVNAMRYAFPDGSIEAQSMETLNAIVDAAQHVDDEVLASAGMKRSSVIEYAHILLGGNGDDAGVELAVALAEKVNRHPDDEELSEAVLRIKSMYGGAGQAKVTPAQRRQLQSAPRNKMDALVEAKSWWADDRAKVGWKRLLEDHECVVINTGVSDNGEMVSDRLTQLMSSMLLFTLREAVMRNCSGWKDLGKSVTIFADELALLSGGSPEVISWFRNQGRSYGVRQVLATQFPDQLHPEVKMSVLGFGTFYWFTQTNAGVAQLAVDDLTADGSEWTRADITGLPKHTAIVRATVDKQRQPATTVRIGYWEGDGGLPIYCADQGYPDTTKLAHPPTERGWMGHRPAPAGAFDSLRESYAVDRDTTDAESDVATPRPANRGYDDFESLVARPPEDGDFDDVVPAKPAPEPKYSGFDPRRFEMGGDDFGPTPSASRHGDSFGNPPRRK